MSDCSLLPAYVPQPAVVNVVAFTLGRSWPPRPCRRSIAVRCRRCSVRRTPAKQRPSCVSTPGRPDRFGRRFHSVHRSGSAPPHPCPDLPEPSKATTITTTTPVRPVATDNLPTTALGEPAAHPRLASSTSVDLNYRPSLLIAIV